MTDIKFSENCYRYIIKFTFEDGNGNLTTTYFRGLDNEVHSTISIWGAERFFSAAEAMRTLYECNEKWPEGNGKLCKVFMSTPVELCGI